MFHYIYTAEGIQDALGLSNLSEVGKKKKVAIGLGYEPSKILNGTEYFDYGQITRSGPAVNHLKLKSQKQIAEINEGENLQLVLFQKEPVRKATAANLQKKSKKQTHSTKEGENLQLALFQ